MILARDKHVLFWLISMATLIIIMISVGGLTRLTESGLSMVNWDPLMGIIPPLSNSAWDTLFDQYKLYPEFKIKNEFYSLKDDNIILLKKKEIKKLRLKKML